MERNSEKLTELKQFDQTLVQKQDVLVRQTNRMENDYANYANCKGGKQSVNNTEKPAVGVKESETSNEDLRK